MMRRELDAEYEALELPEGEKLELINLVDDVRQPKYEQSSATIRAIVSDGLPPPDTTRQKSWPPSTNLNKNEYGFRIVSVVRPPSRNP